MLEFVFPDGSVREFPEGTTGLQIAQSIGPRLAQQAIGVKVGETVYDLSRPLSEGGALRVITPKNDDPDALMLLRHSCAHVLAEAICDLFPGTKLAYGPAIENGFYYDLSTPRPLSEEDFAAIEAKMAELIALDRPFVRCETDVAEAMRRTEGDKYKRDNVERAIARAKDAGKEPVLSFYSNGDAPDAWSDLCAGPHVPSSGFLKACKVLSVSAAYWHGDQSSDSLTRVYGTCFADAKGLKDYLRFLEEAKRRDHRRLGRELDLFHLEEHSPGMVFWHHKGTLLYNAVVDHVRKTILSRGYQEVKTPELVEKHLWEQSGHWAKYREAMFVAPTADGAQFVVKPMNCPCHIEIFKQGLKSFRDLPLRMSEFGKCHRFELAGTMHGIMRVRGFTQDDAHIFCTEEQIPGEVVEFCKLVKDLYADFGFEVALVKFSTRPERRIGSDELWDRAEKALADATAAAGLQTVLNPGEGAFYGPKLEFVLKDCLGRDWQCGTIQVDFNLPERLGASYVGSDGQRHAPVMLHRAALGSIERFVGILIEQYAGDFPLWIAPIQCRVLPISEKFLDYGRDVRDRLLALGVRCELDESNEKIGYKIRQGEQQKIPYLAIVGEKELAENTISVRKRKEGDQGAQTVEAFAAAVAAARK
ncbi:MAG: threonine--tRNA ligase [Fibrobacterales bacterium]|nr:threonine--tRNA ligase [Fibrobacterales bacterium]